jgi:Family of unknown function (DUF5681)
MPAPKKPAGGPNASKFKKGQSGNPGGRPKGAKGMKTLLAQELKESITVHQDGKKKRIRRSEALIKRMVNDALQGRDRPRDTILRYTDAMDRDRQQQAAQELSADDQAILDRYVERRMREMEFKRSRIDGEE